MFFFFFKHASAERIGVFLNGSANFSTPVLRVDRKRSQSAGPGKAIVVAGNEGGKRCNPEDDTGGGGGGGKADNADQVC